MSFLVATGRLLPEITLAVRLIRYEHANVMCCKTSQLLMSLGTRGSRTPGLMLHAVDPPLSPQVVGGN